MSAPNADPFIACLQDNFRPDGFDSEAGSLAISMGRGGARLTHSHQKQYTYVSQSLTLWREIHEAMFELWCHTVGLIQQYGTVISFRPTMWPICCGLSVNCDF